MALAREERARVTALIDRWFGPPGSAERFRARGIWFRHDPDFDALLQENFLADQRHAASGTLTHWQTEAEPCLALLLLLDQLPRNLYRGTAEAFASDTLARETAREALARGFDRSLPQIWRWFIYLPFEHSEGLADQERAVALFAALPESPDKAQAVDYARRHHAIIARFGRFPHRNLALGRVSTPAETAFLSEPDSAF